MWYLSGVYKDDCLDYRTNAYMCLWQSPGNNWVTSYSWKTLLMTVSLEGESGLHMYKCLFVSWCIFDVSNGGIF